MKRFKRYIFEGIADNPEKRTNNKRRDRVRGDRGEYQLQFRKPIDYVIDGSRQLLAMDKRARTGQRKTFEEEREDQLDSEHVAKMPSFIRQRTVGEPGTTQYHGTVRFNRKPDDHPDTPNIRVHMIRTRDSSSFPQLGGNAGGWFQADDTSYDDKTNTIHAAIYLNSHSHPVLDNPRHEGGEFNRHGWHGLAAHELSHAIQQVIKRHGSSSTIHNQGRGRNRTFQGLVPRTKRGMRVAKKLGDTRRTRMFYRMSGLEIEPRLHGHIPRLLSELDDIHTKENTNNAIQQGISKIRESSKRISSQKARTRFEQKHFERLFDAHAARFLPTYKAYGEARHSMRRPPETRMSYPEIHADDRYLDYNIGMDFEQGGAASPQEFPGGRDHQHFSTPLPKATRVRASKLRAKQRRNIGLLQRHLYERSINDMIKHHSGGFDVMSSRLQSVPTHKEKKFIDREARTVRVKRDAERKFRSPKLYFPRGIDNTQFMTREFERLDREQAAQAPPAIDAYKGTGREEQTFQIPKPSLLSRIKSGIRNRLFRKRL
jgi:hypothetical protein